MSETHTTARCEGAGDEKRGGGPAAEALRKSQAQLQAIVENISEAVVVSDMGGQLLHMNPAALAMMGYADVREARRDFDDLENRFAVSGVEGAAWPAEQWPMARILRGERLHDVEARMGRIGADEERVYRFGGAIVRDPEGEPLMGVLTFSDITDRKRVEGELEAKRVALELANHSLAGKNAQLSELHQTALRFMDDVSHELRTPLSVIKGYSEIMHGGMAGPQTEEQAQFNQIIIERTRDMAQMVDDLLDSSKLRAGSLRVDRRGCDVLSIFGAVQGMMESRAAANKITWVQEIEPGLAEVFADVEKATRALANLAVNAIKISPEGSRIVLSAKAGATGDVAISVADQGPGLSPENVALITQRFGQAGRMIGKTKGFGLGLSIALELAALNLGRMEIVSKPGAGSAISFTLPRNDPGVVLARLLEQLENLQTPAGFFGVLRITPEHREGKRGASEELRGFLASSSMPRDVIMATADGEGFVIFGHTEKPLKWQKRLAAAGSAVEQFGRAQKLCAFKAELLEAAAYPAELAKAEAAVVEHVLGDVVPGIGDRMGVELVRS